MQHPTSCAHVRFTGMPLHKLHLVELSVLSRIKQGLCLHVPIVLAVYIHMCPGLGKGLFA